MGVARTPRILRQPAMAIWVWSRISLSSAIGQQQQVDEEQERDQLAEARGPTPARGSRRPTRRRPATSAPKRSASGNITANHLAAPIWARYCVVDGVVEAGPAAALQPVRLHHRRAGHELGHLRQRAADRGADLVVGGQLASLQVAERGDQREEHERRSPGRAARSRRASPPTVPTISTESTIHATAPHSVNCAIVSTSLVTRDTSAPRRWSTWSASDRRWMCSKVRTRSPSRLASAARTSRRNVARLMKYRHDGERPWRSAQAAATNAGPVAVVAEHAAVEDLLDQDRDRRACRRR